MRIPITVLTGYLGSGKTTLINRLLASNPPARMAVLVNDFGAINVDASLIESRDNETISLSNGCVCCSISDDIGAALDAQRDRPDPPSRVLIEASGVADTARLTRHIGNWPGFQLDGALVAVDCDQVRSRAADKFVGKLVQSQIRAAGRALLTKSDLAGGRKASVLDWLAGLHPDLVVSDVQDSGFDILSLLDPSPVEAEVGTDKPQFCTASLRLDAPMHVDQLVAALTGMADQLHRAKGTVTNAATGQSVTIQMVGSRIEVTSAAKPIPGAMVLLRAGAGPFPDDLIGQITGCAVSPGH